MLDGLLWSREGSAVHQPALRCPNGQVRQVWRRIRSTTLEPATSCVATSGVTTVGDDQCAIALLMRLFWGLSLPIRVARRSCFKTFAARLLPGPDHRKVRSARFGLVFDSVPARMGRLAG